MKGPFHNARLLLASLSAAAAMSLAAVPAQAQDEPIIVEPAHAVAYVNGGIGKDEETYMRKIAKDWPLRMTFSERKDNDFVADVGVLVTDKRGVPFLQLHDAGPMTYARLPAGTYRITASFHGQAETHEVTLDGKTGRDIQFHWKGAGA